MQKKFRETHMHPQSWPCKYEMPKHIIMQPNSHIVTINLTPQFGK